MQCLNACVVRKAGTEGKERRTAVCSGCGFALSCKEGPQATGREYVMVEGFWLILVCFTCCRPQQPTLPASIQNMCLGFAFSST